jgi:hypothetical protein
MAGAQVKRVRMRKGAVNRTRAVVDNVCYSIWAMDLAEKAARPQKMNRNQIGPVTFSPNRTSGRVTRCGLFSVKEKKRINGLVLENDKDVTTCIFF